MWPALEPLLRCYERRGDSARARGFLMEMIEHYPGVSPVLALTRLVERDEGQGAALEFLSPVKGPALEQLTVEVGSGIRSAADAAALYDQDVEKQAKQLGLPNW